MKLFLMPPIVILALLIAGLILSRRRHDHGWWLGLTGVVLFYILSLPLTSDFLITSLQISEPLEEKHLNRYDAQAIVVLSAEGHFYEEMNAWMPAPLTIARLRYGAWLGRRTGLPILTSGGVLTENTPSLAAQMRDSLQQEFRLRNVWVEEESKTTWENAVYSAAILRAHGVRRIFLVTHSWHMHRAVPCFEAMGISVIPAPTEIHYMVVSKDQFVPSLHGLTNSYYALYEIVGYLVYELRHFHGPAVTVASAALPAGAGVPVAPAAPTATAAPAPVAGSGPAAPVPAAPAVPK